MENTYYINYIEDRIRQVDPITYHMFVTTLNDHEVPYRELLLSELTILVVLPE